MFDQMSGYSSLDKFTHKINHHSMCSCYIWLNHDISLWKLTFKSQQAFGAKLGWVCFVSKGWLCSSKVRQAFTIGAAPIIHCCWAKNPKYYFTEQHHDLHVCMVTNSKYFHSSCTKEAFTKLIQQALKILVEHLLDSSHCRRHKAINTLRSLKLVAETRYSASVQHRFLRRGVQVLILGRFT